MIQVVTALAQASKNARKHHQTLETAPLVKPNDAPSSTQIYFIAFDLTPRLIELQSHKDPPNENCLSRDAHMQAGPIKLRLISSPHRKWIVITPFPYPH
jgi:hypothetical protein